MLCAFACCCYFIATARIVRRHFLIFWILFGFSVLPSLMDYRSFKIKSVGRWSVTLDIGPRTVFMVHLCGSNAIRSTCPVTMANFVSFATPGWLSESASAGDIIGGFHLVHIAPWMHRKIPFNKMRKHWNTSDERAAHCSNMHTYETVSISAHGWLEVRFGTVDTRRATKRDERGWEKSYCFWIYCYIVYFLLDNSDKLNKI